VLPPPVAPERNGVGIIESAFALFPASSGDDWTNLPPMMQMVAPGKAMVEWQQPDVRESYFTNSWTNVIAAAEASRPVTEMLIQAAAYPAIDFHPEYNKWPEVLFRAFSI
jgi:hypothetical protein